jgi:hypothetical protein
MKFVVSIYCLTCSAVFLWKIESSAAFFIHPVAKTSSLCMSAGKTMVEAPRLLISLKDKLNESAKLVLASQSPRRREILDMMGLAGKYSCEPPPLDESALQVELVKQNLHPTEYTRKLAEAKAHSSAIAASRSSKPIFFLGSDTVVDIDDRILEKPTDSEEAKAMLKRLSGRQVGFYSFLTRQYCC